MTRSRALNRFNRFTAKRRRRSLRSEVPSMRDNANRIIKPINHADNLKDQAVEKEASLDLLEPGLIL